MFSISNHLILKTVLIVHCMNCLLKIEMFSDIDFTSTIHHYIELLYVPLILDQVAVAQTITSEFMAEIPGLDRTLLAY